MTPAQTQFQRLMDIVDELRQKCPWDMKQTRESIRHLTIEETYELSDTILKADDEGMQEEIGDLVMHMIFYASMARDRGAFDMVQVLETQCEKLIRRHPHIYGDLVGATEAEINANWEVIKAQERAMKGETQRSALAGVPDSMPSLIQAHRMQEKASNLGFDWEKPEDVWAKVEEEIAEFQAAESPEEAESEMGDLFFALVNYCRHRGINAEDALAKANQKFKRRFQSVEQQAWADETELKELTLEQMDAYWDKAKAAE
ncbi:MAG: nucleoside triphosphate pyrophosphohydrolase [Bacteroidota bacterium]